MVEVLKTPFDPDHDNWFVCVSCVWSDKREDYVRSRVSFAVFCDSVIVEWNPEGPISWFRIDEGDDVHWSGAKGTNSCGQTVVDDLGFAAASVGGRWGHIFYHLDLLATAD